MSPYISNSLPDRVVDFDSAQTFKSRLDRPRFCTRIRFTALCLLSWVPAGMDKRGAFAPIPLWKCYNVFLCICSYSRTLSRRIIFALFSQSVVGFYRGFAPTSTAAPSLHSLDSRWGDFRSKTPNLPTPGKNPAGAHVCYAVI